ncbi:secretion system effector SseE [Pandoraea aquatica]|uniref:Secretion system effector SseE n=2 Tax=Pandoraea aquatica TaxID=2508290 RepID=A0A5E4YK78_9BURK|nr:secretion system effector SseE [Pandoraea aquatica]
MTVCTRAVAAFFRTHRFTARAEVCERMHITLGQRVENGELSLCHRLDKVAAGYVLTITDFRLDAEARSSDQAVRRFCQLIRTLLRTVPHLSYVRGMILPGVSDAHLRDVRLRLSVILEREGAFWRDEDGDRWLVFCRDHQGIPTRHMAARDTPSPSSSSPSVAHGNMPSTRHHT